MNNSELNQYIDNSRSQGMPDAQIKQNLLAAGWNEQEITSHLEDPAASLPAAAKAVSNPADHQSMWTVFQYILLFITLGISATALAGIAHHWVDQYLNIPKSNGLLSSYTSYFTEALMPEYIASIVIAFPIFAVLFIILRRKIMLDPGVRDIKSRLVFIYIALVWTFVVMVTRAIRVIYSFIAGTDNALASILHLVITLLVAGSIFIYYILEAKKDSRSV